MTIVKVELVGAYSDGGDGMTAPAVTDRAALLEAYGPAVRWESDGGHEWLRVPRVLLDGIVGISSYSYMDSAYVYLEGDCDARLFYEAYNIANDSPTATGFGAREVRHNGLAPLRNLDHYSPEV